MQSIPVFLNDYGEIVLEIDRLIKADRESLNSIAPQRGNKSASNPVTGAQPSVCQMLAQAAAGRESKPKPTLWQTSPPIAPYTDSASGSPASRGSDQRQTRLFKTRFCSYGLDCPYLAKGKCLYAHSKEEIRLRPPPPSGYRVPVVRASRSVAPDQSPTGSNESVWSLPESPVHATQRDSLLECGHSASLLDCLVSSDSIRSTMGGGSSSFSSLLGGAV